MKTSCKIRKFLYVAVLAFQGCDSPAPPLLDRPNSEPVGSQAMSIPNAPWPVTYVNQEQRTLEGLTAVSESNLQLLKRQGYAGDPVSAVLVAELYERSEPFDKDAVQNWRRIAAENGDTPSCVAHAFSLQQMGGEENCLRAKFWLEKAALGQAKLPRPNNDKTSDPAKEVGLYALRDHWQQCLDGHAAGYLGMPAPDEQAFKDSPRN